MSITAKKWSKEFENAISAQWELSSYGLFDSSTHKPIFSIDTPPPYINTPVHIGHASTYTIMDMIARYKRMKGFAVLFPLGLDKNGLPIEFAVEKKFKIHFDDVSREEFIGKCHELLAEASAASLDSFKRLGHSYSSWRLGDSIGEIYETDSESYRALTQATFIDMWNKGLIYEDTRINNYSPKDKTTLADAEIDYKEVDSFFNDVVFTVKETGEKIVIGTTRPELICALGMVIYHPDDERYQHLTGKTAVSPLFNAEVPIMAHPYAKLDKGTGLVMMCSAGDVTDIRFFREQGLSPLICIGADGRMNEKADFLSGLTVTEARRKIIEVLQEKKLLVSQTPIRHKIPVSERSGGEIEFIEMTELYVKQLSFKDDMKRLASQLHFYEESSRHILLDWINAVAIDWPITRSRYYATEVPMWKHMKTGEVLLAPKGRYVQPWKELPPATIVPSGCSPEDYVGDTRVFDTWFDSSISPLYILGYERYPLFFSKVGGQCSLRPQGKEIVRTWLYYTLLKDYHLTGTCIFRDVWIHHHIIDEQRQKMSKSRGNVIDPYVILEKYGAEPFRLWCAVEGNLAAGDIACSYQRIEAAGKTLTKLWNVARFISQFPAVSSEKSLLDTDRWILGELQLLVSYADERYALYDFHTPAVQMRHFLWEFFASHYLELVKSRAYNVDGVFSAEEQQGALWTLHYCLQTLLQLFSPIIPFITFTLYEALYGGTVHECSFPVIVGNYSVPFTSEDVVALNSLVWKTKQDAGKSLRDSVSVLTLPDTMQSLARDLQQMHSADAVVYGALDVTL